MLIEFNVENYRSISDKVTLTMVPSQSQSKSYSIINIESNSNIKRILKSLVIYGANGAGKTNTIHALSSMRGMVIKSKNFNRGDPCRYYYPFILDNEHSSKPTIFDVFFLKDNIEYHYEFAFDLERIIYESLSFFSETKEEIFIFKRSLDVFEPYRDIDFLTSLFQSTGDNVLFLSKANNEYREFGPVFDWFNKNLLTLGPLDKLSEKYTLNYFNKSPENAKKIIDFMHYADFDIYDIIGNLKKSNFQELMSGNLPFTIKIRPSNENNLDLNSNVDFIISDIKTVRKKIDGTEIIQNFRDFESSGTLKFFEIAGLWFEALENKNKILVIDEFDIKLHPDLQEYLIKIFHDPNINKMGSQLIFTTHNTRLLSLDFYRRDQIIFVEKNKKTKSTEINYLYDYEKRQDKSIEKGYFLGRYGGLPDIEYGMFKE
jgi:uncharacterized protein